jgi:formylglycine-generating enzyme required for sulfatase activity
MKRNICTCPFSAFLITLICLISFAANAETSRALKVIATDAVTRQTGEINLYRKSYAVIIGIDQYANLPADKQLTYAVKDAKGIADVLKRQYKFDQIITLYNKEATRKNITKLLAVDLPKQLTDQDALFVFWAGHGNQETSREGDIGYLIPHDGSIDDITSNLTMSEIRDTVSKKIPAKHIFYVMDACYSGLLTETRSIDKAPRRDLAYLQDITRERVRQVLTAGGKNQEVLDGGANGHSVFTGRLIELLEKAGDFITANEIQAIIKEKVNGDARARNHQQTPAYGTLYGSGDFVFIPSMEQKVADNRAEILKLEAELKALDAAADNAKNSTSRAEADRQKREADLAKKSLDGKLKIEQLKQEQLAAEGKRREAEEAERLRLLAAKSADDKRLAQLKIEAEARRKNITVQKSADFATLDSAVAEIKRLNEQINRIEKNYEKEISRTREEVSKRYEKQLDTVKDRKRDEFEKPDEFKAKQNQQREQLIRQRDAELARLSISSLAAAETDPLRESIKLLAEREYTLGAEQIAAELGNYDAVAQTFPLSLKSKVSGVKLAMNGSIPLRIDDAKAFKQYWVAGLVRPEAKIRAGTDPVEIVLANDADNSRLILFGDTFMTPKRKQELEDLAYKPEMVVIPAGSFEMGSNDGKSEEKPGHRVTLKTFAMGKTEVTQGQWKIIMGSNPSNFNKCGDNCPVEKVSWDDVQVFIKKLNAKTGKQYRLPTEAEWEYVCHSGGKQDYCGSEDIGAVAWHSKNSDNKTQPVAQKKANAFGLYDMTGNVREWVEDVYHDNYNGAPTDGKAWAGEGSKRVIRGGSWDESSQDLRALNRRKDSTSERDKKIGFRLAR